MWEKEEAPASGVNEIDRRLMGACSPACCTLRPLVNGASGATHCVGRGLGAEVTRGGVGCSRGLVVQGGAVARSSGKGVAMAGSAGRSLLLSVAAPLSLPR